MQEQINQSADDLNAMATNDTIARRGSSAAGVDAPNGEHGCNATAEQSNEPYQQMALAERYHCRLESEKLINDDNHICKSIAVKKRRICCCCKVENGSTRTDGPSASQTHWQLAVIWLQTMSYFSRC